MTSVAVPTCAYCGLPAPRSWWGTSAPGEDAAFCCYGCRFAASVADAKPSASGGMFTRLGLAIFCTMNVMAFTMALWSGDVYAEDDSAIARSLHGLFRYLSMFFAIPVFYSLGLPLLENAWDSLKRGIANIDVLLIAGVAASYAVSVYSVFRDEGPIYFEVGCAVLVLVTLGRWLEATGKARASQSLEALEKLLPETICLLDNGRETIVPLRDVTIGAILRVRAGERIPCDGVVLEQAAHVDEQLLTGESTVRTKEPDDAVHAGTLNVDSDLLVRVSSLPDDGALARLVRLVRQAQESKGRFEQTADRLARWFLPLVAVIAIGATVYHGTMRDWDSGVLVGLSVVLIACPCALGIATPLAMWTALGIAARQRVLIHGGDVLERLARVQHIFFDKTGTLTTGTPIVQQVVVATGENRDDCFGWATMLTAASRHVHSQAICRFLNSDVSDERSHPVQTLAGRGLRLSAEADGDIVLGSEHWMRELDMTLPEDLRAACASSNAAVCLAWAGRVRCVFLLAEEWRPEAVDVLNDLAASGVRATILTGDANLRAAPCEARTGLLPEDKLQILEQTRRSGNIVAMVGDGINDGPALAASDVGIALGCGADVARDAAGVCLLDNDLRKIPWAIALAKQTVRVMQQNLFWAFAYNVVGIALASMGKLNPVLAAVAMTLSSLFVLANSLRLRALVTPQSSSPILQPEARPT